MLLPSLFCLPTLLNPAFPPCGQALDIRRDGSHEVRKELGQSMWKITIRQVKTLQTARNPRFSLFADDT